MSLAFNLHPLMAAALAPFAPRNSVVHLITEEQRAKADLWYSHHKASGQLRVDEDHRALVAQVQFGDAE